MSEVQEWVSVSQSASGDVVVRVSLNCPDEHLSARWSVKTYASKVKVGVRDARAGAYRGLDQLREAMAELEEES